MCDAAHNASASPRSKAEIITGADKPAAMPIDLDGIPQDLKSAAHWIGWCWGRRDDKWTKIPTNAKSFRKFRVGLDKPFRFELVRYRFAGKHTLKRPDGMGFVFAVGARFTGIDLDDCRNIDTGAIEPWAATIIAKLNTYTEVSPSGTGVKLFLRGELPPGSGNRHDNIEVYSQRRFFCVTGQRVPGTPATVEERQPELEQFVAEYIPQSTADKPSKKDKDYPTQEPAKFHEMEFLEDGELIERATQNPLFWSLWTGGISEYDNNPSRADLALCLKLAWWTNGDENRMDRLFRLSGLFRAKWDEMRGETTYGQRTITKACRISTTRRDGVQSKPLTQHQAAEIDASIAVVNLPAPSPIDAEPTPTIEQIAAAPPSCAVKWRADPRGFINTGAARNRSCGVLKAYANKFGGVSHRHRCRCPGCDFCLGYLQRDWYAGRMAWADRAEVAAKIDGRPFIIYEWRGFNAERWTKSGKTIREADIRAAVLSRKDASFSVILQNDGTAVIHSEIPMPGAKQLTTREAFDESTYQALLTIPRFCGAKAKRFRPVRHSHDLKAPSETTGKQCPSCGATLQLPRANGPHPEIDPFEQPTVTVACCKCKRSCTVPSPMKDMGALGEDVQIVRREMEECKIKTVDSASPNGVVFAWVFPTIYIGYEKRVMQHLVEYLQTEELPPGGDLRIKPGELVSWTKEANRLKTTTDIDNHFEIDFDALTAPP